MPWTIGTSGLWAALVGWLSMLNCWLDGSVWEITLIDCSVVWISAEFFAPDSSPVPFPIFYQTYSWPGTATLLTVVWKTPLYRNNSLCIHSPESSGFPFWMRKQSTTATEHTSSLDISCSLCSVFFIPTSPLISVWCVRPLKNDKVHTWRRSGQMD